MYHIYHIHIKLKQYTININNDINNKNNIQYSESNKNDIIKNEVNICIMESGNFRKLDSCNMLTQFDVYDRYYAGYFVYVNKNNYLRQENYMNIYTSSNFSSVQSILIYSIGYYDYLYEKAKSNYNTSTLVYYHTIYINSEQCEVTEEDKHFLIKELLNYSYNEGCTSNKLLYLLNKFLKDIDFLFDKNQFKINYLLQTFDNNTCKLLLNRYYIDDHIYTIEFNIIFENNIYNYHYKNSLYRFISCQNINKNKSNNQNNNKIQIYTHKNQINTFIKTNKINANTNLIGYGDYFYYNKFMNLTNKDIIKNETNYEDYLKYIKNSYLGTYLNNKNDIIVNKKDIVYIQGNAKINAIKLNHSYSDVYE